MSELRVALQLYTVRDETEKDYFGTLAKVAAMGYKAVQVSGMFNHTAKEIRKCLDDLGLSVAGVHEGLDGMRTDLSAVMDRAATLGTKDIVCPWANETREPNAAAYDAFAEELNRIGQACADAGFRLSYHNHAFEFQLIDGEYGLKRLFARTDPRLVKVECDVGWTYYAGVDPAVWLRGYPGRCPLVHAKDHDKANKDINTPVGDGALNWKDILEACREIGSEWLIVEEDKPTRPSLHSAAISLRNLQAMGLS
ncbi:MAG: sugar phosphate isomerase/epimerase [Armatimonadetes bacterium]|nr:sugar phosphate isomerase/epimerase [Armatimonadota bacterium]